MASEGLALAAPRPAFPPRRPRATALEFFPVDFISFLSLMGSLAQALGYVKAFVVGPAACEPCRVSALPRVSPAACEARRV